MAVLVIRIAGQVKNKAKDNETLKRLKMRRKFSCVLVDEKDQIWVADACNHRIQVFDTEGNLVRLWGSQGKAQGRLYYPYDLALVPDGTVYVCEFGNHRVQKFTADGRSLGCWGAQGRGEGQLHNPWALVRDSRGRIYVVDTYNHRVQRVRM